MSEKLLSLENWPDSYKQAATEIVEKIIPLSQITKFKVITIALTDSEENDHWLLGNFESNTSSEEHMLAAIRIFLDTSEEYEIYKKSSSASSESKELREGEILLFDRNEYESQQNQYQPSL